MMNYFEFFLFLLLFYTIILYSWTPDLDENSMKTRLQICFYASAATAEMSHSLSFAITNQQTTQKIFLNLSLLRRC